MRKQYVLGMTLIASLAFASCSKDEQVVQEGNGIETVQDDGQVLTLQVSNSGDGLTTRAGRPLLSSQAKQDINTIILYVVAKGGSNDGKVVLEKTISADEWKNALAYSNTNGHGKQLEISFKNSDKQKLADGTYTIYAIGYYETGANYKDIKIASAPTTTGEGSTSVSFPANGLYALLNNNDNPAEEIFAGQVEVTAKTDKQFGSYLEVSTESTADKKVVPALVLNRQVAGVTGYFTNLPAKVGEQIPTKIRLVASNKSNKVHFTSMVSGETDGTTTAAATSVVNGSAISLTADLPYWNSSKNGYNVYEIDLASFFTQMSGQSAKTFDKLDLDKDGFVGYKDAQYYVYKMSESNITFADLAKKDTDGKTFLEKTWAAAIKGEKVTVNTNEITANKLEGFWNNANANQTLVAGSVFAGEFIIPFLQVSGTNTFELQLLNGDNILKTWNVQVPLGQTVGVGQGSVADGIEGTWSADTNTLIYNIYRNHLYSLGMKTADGDGGTKPDPDPEGPDTPEDLSKGQDLLINVNDNWEIIHNMEID